MSCWIAPIYTTSQGLARSRKLTTRGRLFAIGSVDDGNDVLHVCGQCGVLFDVCLWNRKTIHFSFLFLLKWVWFYFIFWQGPPISFYSTISRYSSHLAITTAYTNMIAMTLPVVWVFRTVRIFATSQVFFVVHWFSVISSNRVADIKENSTLSADM